METDVTKKQYRPNDATTKLVRTNPKSIQRVLFETQKSCHGLDLYDIYSLYIHGSYLNMHDESKDEFCIVFLTDDEKSQCLKILKREHHPNIVAIQNLMWNKWLMVVSIVVTLCVGITSVMSSGTVIVYNNTTHIHHANWRGSISL